MQPVLDLPDHPTVDEALTLQRALAARVEQRDRPGPIQRIAGVDVAYSETGDEAFAAVCVLDAATLAIVETIGVVGTVRFPYVPGLLSFREIPPLREALAQLSAPVDLVVCDGHGRAHPARFGLACHLGLLYDVPTIGCGKTRLIGRSRAPGSERGRFARLMDDGEEIGQVLRTQTGVRPVYVSVGHAIGLNTARRTVLRLAAHWRLPETTRAADGEANRLRREHPQATPQPRGRSKTK